MAAETLEDLKPNSQAPNEDVAAAEPKSEENHNNQEKEVEEAEEQQHNDKEKKIDSDGQKDSNESEDEEEIEEEVESGGKTKRKGSAKAEQNGSNNSVKERDPATPASGRPYRERKTVERYMVSSPSKFPGFSSTKSMSIEQGHGTQLKDIPNGSRLCSDSPAEETRD